MGDAIHAATAADMSDGDVKIVEAGKHEIGLVRHAGEFYAYLNVCPHQGGPVCQGMMMPRVLEVLADDQRSLGQTFDETEMHLVCPWHGYEYRVTDGVNAADPKIRLRRFRTSVRDGEVYIEL